MRKISVAIALALSLFSAPVLAQNECQSFKAGHAEVQSRFPDVTTVEYTGLDARRLIGAFNQIPPESDVNGDRVIAATLPSINQSVLLILKGDCIQATLPGFKEQIEDFVRKALRRQDI